ncbi:Acyltransferase domain-containing protein [Sulfidibacter corallicola]|uniref:Acyltransferase domain-containing protein n=1 Tax=Sulfidibacter corallicola TaxID=2818388 RepID=A0A8A4TR96_SULCO|nr:type I polyketide synthase [Sulfidibacter corallicola]QTD52489.1 acyltransferase domain-containing protein [Sulfidibacter corallicola]
MTQTDRSDCAIALTGMACLFPGAEDLAAFRHNLRTGVDAIREVPPQRWEPLFYDPESAAPDRFYCLRGGFVDDLVDFDPLVFGIMPVAAEGAEPDQMISLKLAAAVLADAGYREGDYDAAKAGVIIARGNYIGAGMTRLEQHVRTSAQLVHALQRLVPGIDAAALARVKAEFQGGLGHYGPDTAIGLVPNLTASRLANRLNLFGPAYTVDAACAGSLLAVDQAVRELRSGRCDLVLAGGIHLSHDVAFWSVFSQLGALSRDQQIRPFDRRADGLLIGEGAGMVCLKRLEDAERDGDRIYAVIRGVGIASDGRTGSLMSPSVDGQVLALERAWREAGLEPERLGFLEAHGTGTPAGDAAELETLTRFFGSARPEHPPIGLGSVKSMIGHTMPAAGMAGLIKAALAIYHGEHLPTLHCEHPCDALRDTRFLPVNVCAPWETRAGETRIAAVNAFGFGGINAHLVLESVADPAPVVDPRATVLVAPPSATTTDLPRLAVFAAEDGEDLVRALTEKRSCVEAGSASWRVAIVNPTEARLERAKTIVRRGVPWRGRNGIYFTNRPVVTPEAKLAFVFPGVDSSFEPRLADIANHFHMALPARTDPGALQSDLLAAGIGIIQTNRFLHRTLLRLGIEPDAVAGHSIGEWSGLMAAGCVPEREADAFGEQLQPGSLNVPDVQFLAAGCSLERAREAMIGLDDLSVSHENCPRQVILCGRPYAIAEIEQRLQDLQVLTRVLPFQSGFHSPLYRDYLEPHRAFFLEFPMFPPRIPLWSATLAAPYPEDVPAIRELSLRHLVEPVRFRSLIERMYADGFRTFVQVGTGSLPGFIADTLGDRPHLALHANLSKRTGLEQLAHMSAALWAEGAAVDPSHFREGRAEPAAMSEPASSSAEKRATMRLKLGVPLVELNTPLELPRGGERPDRRALPFVADLGPTGTAGRAFQSLLGEIETAGSDVVRALAGQRSEAPGLNESLIEPDWSASGSRERPPGNDEGGSLVRTFTRHLSVDRVPELLDHTFFAQPPDWPILNDRYPVVPMTMSLQIMVDIARESAPGFVVTALEDIQAFRWLLVDEPLDLRIVTRRLDAHRLEIDLKGYARATAVLADAPPDIPEAPDAPIAGETSPDIDADTLYRDRWMFHGPAYQGVTALEGIGPQGIRGRIALRRGPGSLLDSAGQLLGYWIMARNDKDRLAMPIGIGRIEFFGPDPEIGEELGCSVEIGSLTDQEVSADMVIWRGDQVWARIEGWRDRRFETDERLWRIIMQVDRHLLAVPRPCGALVFRDRYRLALSRDQLSRRFLTKVERDAYGDLDPRLKRRWLNGRIVAKDALRHHLDLATRHPIFPAEIRIEGPAEGVVTAHYRDERWLIVVALHGDLAVARLGRTPLGLAVADLHGEAMETMPSVAHFLTHDELAMLPGTEPAREAVRFWAAKRAYARWRGAVPDSDLRNFSITHVHPKRIEVEDRLGAPCWVATYASRNASGRTPGPESPSPGERRSRRQAPEETQDYIITWTE